MCIADIKLPAMKEALSKNDLGKVRDAAIILSRTLQKHITIPELSIMVDLPQKKLKAGFMEIYGKGVYTYLKYQRLQRIKEMLLQDMPLKGIAIATGYKDKSSLIKAFRNEFDLTPGEWKKRQGLVL